MSPVVPGEWQWLDPTPLIFQAHSLPGSQQARFPYATKFTVKVKAGTHSAHGAVLESDYVMRFTTAMPWASSCVDRDYHAATMQPTLVITFSQSVDTTRILPLIKLRGFGSFELRKTTKEEDEKLLNAELAYLRGSGEVLK
eukprot:TRINITY_DN38975_c0_g1_i1.p1 TRINITY_DN38975_c0_g1~~TRINITY_DN38975_c0_g1_i1.p1  ORF type:complete len:141 (-),score=17.36 TRINITY_DN38975_c0_g1_i1:177-599(-)